MPSIWSEFKAVNSSFKVEVENALEHMARTLMHPQGKAGSDLVRVGRRAWVAVASMDTPTLVDNFLHDLDFKKAEGYLLTTRFNATDVREIYWEFHGLEKFEGVPIEGGVAAAELKYKFAWRKSYNKTTSKHFAG